MKRRKNKTIKIMIFICSVLLLGCIILAVEFWMIYGQRNELQKVIIQLKEENNQLQNKLKNLNVKKAEQELEEQISDQFMDENDIQLQDDYKPIEEATIVPPKGKSNSFDVNLETVEAGTILSAEEVIANKDNYFSAFDIIEGDTVYNRIIGKSYQENENVGLADLKYLKMVHYNFDHQIQMGEMIVNVAIYEDVLNVFKELFDM